MSRIKERTWVSHDGADFPRGMKKSTLVTVVMRDGSIERDFAGTFDDVSDDDEPMSFWLWDSEPCRADIVWYYIRHDDDEVEPPLPKNWRSKLYRAEFVHYIAKLISPDAFYCHDAKRNLLLRLGYSRMEAEKIAEKEYPVRWVMEKASAVAHAFSEENERLEWMWEMNGRGNPLTEVPAMPDSVMPEGVAEILAEYDRLDAEKFKLPANKGQSHA